MMGMRIWAEHQEKLLPKLRELTKPGEVSKPSIENFAVVFIEPRCHPSCEYVLRNFRAALPSIPIRIVHGTENEEFLKTMVSKIAGEFSFVNCGLADLPPPSYNTMLTSKKFWNLFTEDNLLIAQSDTMLMDSAEEYFAKILEKNYAFLGAPWSYTCHACQAPLDGGCGHMIDQKVVASMAPHMVGNGGLSLRNRSAALRALEKYKLEKVEALASRVFPHANAAVQEGCTNEDVFFCKSFYGVENMPTRQEALEFSIEQVPPFSWNSGPCAIGCHKPWGYMHPALVKGILEKSKF